MNMALYVILGISPQANSSGPHFRFRNTGFTTLTYIPGRHRWLVTGVDDQKHCEDAQ